MRMSEGEPADAEASASLAPLLSEDGLAHRIREERRRRGWSQEELARRVEAILGGGFPQSAVSKIEKGKGRRAITVDEALAFSKVFETELTDLLLPATVARTRELTDILLRMIEAKEDMAGAHARYIAGMVEFGQLVERAPELGDSLREFTESAAVPSDQRAAVTHLLAEIFDYSGPFAGIAAPGELLPPGSTKQVIE